MCSVLSLIGRNRAGVACSGGVIHGVGNMIVPKRRVERELRIIGAGVVRSSSSGALQTFGGSTRGKAQTHNSGKKNELFHIESRLIFIGVERLCP